MKVWEVIESLPPVNMGWASENKSHGLYVSKPIANRAIVRLRTKQNGFGSFRVIEHEVHMT